MNKFMIYCVKCGASNDENMNFCQSCGHTLSSTEVVTNSPAYNPLKGKAITSMVLGIVSLVFCWFYGILGLVPGIIGLSFAMNIKKIPEAYSKNAGFTNAGYICSLIGVIISAVIILIVLIACISCIACTAASAGSASFY